MENQKLTKSFVQKQADDCRNRINILQNEIQQNYGVIQHCEWMLKFIDFSNSETTQVVEIPINDQAKGIVLE